MPRAMLGGVAPSGPAGVTLTWGAPTVDGDAVRPGNVLLVRNTSAGAITLTLVTGGTSGNYAVADPTVAVPAGATVAVGPFGQVFPQTSGTDAGWVYVDYSAVAGVERTVIAL